MLITAVIKAMSTLYRIACAPTQKNISHRASVHKGIADFGAAFYKGATLRRFDLESESSRIA